MGYDAILERELEACSPREVPEACVDFNIDDGLDLFNEIQLNVHNEFRSGHVSTANLTYNVDLAKQAYEYACHLATVVGKLEHAKSEDRPNQGENLYWQWSSKDENLVATNVTAPAAQAWYSEIEDYNFTDHTKTGVVGHFTQMVWQSTTSLGCGWAGE